eukprot:1916722-Rhodomonas_salina.1
MRSRESVLEHLRQNKASDENLRENLGGWLATAPAWESIVSHQICVRIVEQHILVDDLRALDRQHPALLEFMRPELPTRVFCNPQF